MLRPPLLTLLTFLAGSGAAWAEDYREAPAPARTVIPAIDPADYAPGTFAELLVETNAYGFVTRVEVKTTSQPAFAQACVEAIRRWRYAPAREFGQPVAAKFVQPFRLTNGTLTIPPGRPVDAPPPQRPAPE